MALEERVGLGVDRLGRRRAQPRARARRALARDHRALPRERVDPDLGQPSDPAVAADVGDEVGLVEVDALVDEDRPFPVGGVLLPANAGLPFALPARLARQAKLPVIIHCREAWPDCLALLEENWRSSGLGGIFHCFSGTLEEARRGLEMGFLVSFAGNSTYPKAQNLRNVAAELPLANLLIETDAPYLAPQSRRGKRNEPAFVAEVAHALASVRNLSAEDFAGATAENFRRFFRLAPASSSAHLAAEERRASN